MCKRLKSRSVKDGWSDTGRLLGGSGRFEADGWSSHLQVVLRVLEGRLGVVHGQHQARAPHHQLVVPTHQLSVQVIGGGSAGTAAGAGACGISTDRDVAVGQADVAVRQDQVGVVVLQLALILVNRRRNGTECKEVTSLF